MMQVDAVRDALTVRVGSTFGAPDVMRLEKTVNALGPFSRLTIDFVAARECDDAALVYLARVLAGIEDGEVTVRGLTTHQWRLLTYMGVHLDNVAGAPH